MVADGGRSRAAIYGNAGIRMHCLPCAQIPEVVGGSLVDRAGKTVAFRRRRGCVGCVNVYLYGAFAHDISKVRALSRTDRLRKRASIQIGSDGPVASNYVRRRQCVGMTAGCQICRGEQTLRASRGVGVPIFILLRATRSRRRAEAEVTGCRRFISTRPSLASSGSPLHDEVHKAP